jgi:hypothetical protein
MKKTSALAAILATNAIFAADNQEAYTLSNPYPPDLGFEYARHSFRDKYDVIYGPSRSQKIKSKRRQARR